MSTIRAKALCVLIACMGAFTSSSAHAGNILFIGNSFTFAFGSPVRYYRPDSVTDLNGTGQGGVPALFKAFATEAGLSYEVYLETSPGIGIDWHLANKLPLIGSKPWVDVVMHGYSTLDAKKPGDPTVLIASVKQMSDLLRSKDPTVRIRIMSTWPRADQTYQPQGAWYGKPIETMARDVRDGYDRAAAMAPAVKGVIPVGDAWLRAMHSGVADPNPYDGVEPGKMDLWAYDHYHASTAGSYLEALVIFGSVTGIDPRYLGTAECSAYELGLSTIQVAALEQVAFDQLFSESLVKAAPRSPSQGKPAAKCTAPRQRA